jgi:selenocysteine lyase/cysteine desulfurase
MGSVSNLVEAGPEFPRLRREYLLDPRVTYLNHASIGTVPRAVHRAGIRYREICEENPWLYIWGGEWEDAREEVRQKAAGLLGCSPGEVAITHNTTEGFNVLAQGLPLRPGDEVLFSSLNHAGASVCWEHFGEKFGYSVRTFEFPVGDVPGLSAAEVVDLHRRQIRPETRVLVLPHIDNIVGLRHPLGELTRMAREEGVQYVLVDGAQSAGMIPLRLPASGVDAYATSPHKWIQSPKGLGLLYLSSALLESVSPLWVTWGQARWQGTARLFEDYGTRDLPEVLSLGDALDFQRALGEGRKESAYRRMFGDLMDRVDGTSGLIWRSPRQWERGSILVAVGLRDAGAAETSDTLFQAHGIVVRPFPQEGLNALRVSPNLMNTLEEMDGLITRLESFG